MQFPVFVVWAALAVVGVLAPALAADDAFAVSDVAIGFDGAAKVGRWTPVTFRVSGTPGATVESSVTAPDPDGSDTIWTFPASTIDDSGTCVVSGQFKLGRLAGQIRIAAGAAEVVAQIGTNVDAPGLMCVPYEQRAAFIGVLGEAPGFRDAYSADAPVQSATGDALPVRLIEFPDSESLPLTLDAYDAIDVMVLSQRFDLDAQRANVLADWVRNGGHVVLILGGDPQAFTASPVSSWAPIRTTESARFTELAALVERVRGSSPLAVLGGIAGVRLTADNSQLLAGSFAGPLATRSPYGLGRVTALALDWSNPQVGEWNGLPGLCRFLADIDVASEILSSNAEVELRPTGVSELATQLASQLDHFGSIQRPSYWTVIAFAAAFMLLVGPLDYLLVHRVLKQPRLTWFTFPAWIIFAATAASLGADRLNSTERLANQFDLVDIDAATGLRRSQSWMTFSSPSPRRFRIAATAANWLANSDAAPMQFSWCGRPESGFGGMYRAGGLNLGNPPYTIDSFEVAENIPIGQWSSKAFVAEWGSALDATDEPLVTSALEDDGTNLLKGTFTHHLPEAITDWCVCYDKGAYFPGDPGRVDRTPAIEPGVPWSPLDRVQRRLTKTYLQGGSQIYRTQKELKGASGDPSSVTRVDYDPLGLDPFPLARMMTFYEAADGFEYTHGLANSSLQRSDLSRLLQLKRAVVFGRIATASAEYTVDGQPVQPQERWTYVRFVLPVKPGVAPSLRDTGRLNTR
ncbi:MAG: hypothetical protein JNG89_03440 [Planctomycetaceae bacterium]|nr:hypothetical protein [Planctomycetaceae bacterium]